MLKDRGRLTAHSRAMDVYRPAEAANSCNTSKGGFSTQIGMMNGSTNEHSALIYSIRTVCTRHPLYHKYTHAYTHTRTHSV